MPHGDLGKRDNNEADIIKELEDSYVSYHKMPEGAGFDGIVPFRGHSHIIELKNPEYVPKHGDRTKMLTDGEKATKRLYELNEVPYHICISAEEILEAIGAK